MATQRLTKRSQHVLVLVLAVGLVISTRRSAMAQGAISNNAWVQIQTLAEEKKSRTPAQRKVDSNMVLQLKRNRGIVMGNGLDTLDLGVNVARNGKMEVDIRADVTDALLAAIRGRGGEIVNSHPQYKAIRARITLEQAESLAAMPEVRFVRPAERFMTNKLTTSQGDHAHRADVARTSFSLTGAGIRIGVLSDGVDSSPTLQASGDLPSSFTVLPGQAGSGDEGSAMLEIVYDMCPNASLYFATAFNGEASFATNILNLRAAGCDIIIDDVFYFLEGVFQDGTIAQAVNSVTADGALYFSSIGNSGNLDAGTAGCWEGDYVGMAIPSGVPAYGYISALDFGGGTNYDTITLDTTSYFILSWSDPMGASSNDYDLFVLNAQRTAVRASSTNFQSGTQDPFEYIDSTTRNDAKNTIVVVKYSGSNRFMHLTANRGCFAINTAGQASGHACAADAFGVAASGIPQLSGGTFVGLATTPTLETFTSDGPRRLFYNADGTTITPGNVSSTGGTVRNKPDITAADGVACSAPGFNPFYGTSAAAPHAGAIAALIKAHNPALTPAEIRSRLITYARDLAAYGYDRDAGHGVVDTLSGATPIELASLDASRYGDAVLLEWRTGYEVSNLGFHIYREENGRKTRVTQQLVAGSALMAGADTHLTAGQSYSFCDVPPGAADSMRYWLEDVDLNGKRTLHGPVAPVYSDNPLPGKRRSILLAELGRHHGDTEARVRNLKAALQSLPSAGFERSVKPLRTITALRPLEKRDGHSLDLRQKQWQLAAEPAIKLRVNQEGWYRVSPSDLVAAGFNSNTDRRLLQLYCNGVEQPIDVRGEPKSRSGQSVSIEFYGTGQDTLWTDARTYWLVAGTRPGRRLSAVSGGGGEGPALECFPFTVERKDRAVYFTALRNGDSGNFFGPIITAEPLDQLLTVSHIAASAPEEATLEVTLQGVTVGEHRVAIQINGIEVGTAVFAGQSNATASVAIPQLALREGDNLVTLAAAGGVADVSLLDAVRLTYWRSYIADDNALRFTATGGRQVALRGFTSAEVRVVDITDPAAPVEVRAQTRPRTKGETIVRFQTPGSGPRTLLAFTPDGTKKPAAIVANRPSTWHDAGQRGEITVIAHGSLLESLVPLRNFREQQGASVALIDVEDLYDEFGFGDKNVSALRDFLALAASNWQTPPRHLLLAGEASIDPRNFLGFGETDLVPIRMVDTPTLEAPSDDWFADFNGDDLPEIAVGRLPVRTSEEAATVVSKIIAYETAGAGDWTKRALLVADNKDVIDFSNATDAVSVLLPATITVDRISLGNITSARGALMEKLNAGLLLVNYLGHGSVDKWAAEELLANEDAEALTNGPRLPVVLSMTCLNGFIADPSRDCLAEALIKAKGGGAIAVWTSTGFTDPACQIVLDQELIRQLFDGKAATLGEAVRAAKAGVGSPELRRTWILIGDPATRLK